MLKWGCLVMFSNFLNKWGFKNKVVLGLVGRKKAVSGLFDNPA
jgi:hypothetical protein